MRGALTSSFSATVALNFSSTKHSTVCTFQTLVYLALSFNAAECQKSHATMFLGLPLANYLQYCISFQGLP